MTTTYRIAGPADVPAIRALIERGYRGDSARLGWTHEADLLDGDRTSDAEIAASVSAPNKRVLIAERGDVLIGTVTVSDLGNHLAYLGMLCVDPLLQAGGLGRELIARVETLAAQDFGAKITEMTVVDARPELIAYYERRGYACTGEIRAFPLPIDVPFRMVVLERQIGGV